MIELGFETAGVKVGAAGGLVVSVYQTASVEVLDQVDALQARVLAAHGRLAALTVMENISPMARMDEATRKKSADLAIKYAPNSIGGAIIIRGKGIGSVMARTSLSAVLLLAPGGVELKVFKTIDDGLLWLRTRPTPNPLVDNPVTAVEIETFIKR